MLLTLFLFFLSAAVIYVACEFFVNGVEWVGHRFQLGATATGTVLAAFGTALPESAVTFMAVVFGDTPEQKDIGVGAAMGGPLVLATLAYAVVGLALWRARRGKPTQANCINADQRRLARDQAWFMGIFIFKVGLGLLAFAWKPWLGFVFLVTYALYIKRELSNDEASLDSDDLEPLKLRPRDEDPSMFWAVTQTVMALVVIAGASHVFGLSTQSNAYQTEMASRLHLPFPVLSDEKLALTHALKLPTMEVAGLTLIKRLALVIDDARITHVFYPVFPPDRNAGDVLDWLKANPAKT